MDYYKKLSEQNKIFAKILKKNQVTSINFIIIGNSLASGYTVASKIKPLFERNKTLSKELKKQNISNNIYHFSQPYDNPNKSILSWIKNNQTQKEVLAQQIKHYFSGPRKNIDKNNIDLQTLKKYFSKNIKDKQGIKNLIKNQQKHNLNIIVFSGNTGATMDYVENNSILNSCKAIWLGAKKDLVYCKKTIKYIYKLNPKNLIVVINLPFHERFPFIIFDGVILIFNYLVKFINRKIPNLIFTKGGTIEVKCYQIDNQKIFDIHPDEKHYIKMLYHCIHGINKNYSKIIQ
jgi:hypothetical protein